MAEFLGPNGIVLSHRDHLDGGPGSGPHAGGSFEKKQAELKKQFGHQQGLSHSTVSRPSQAKQFPSHQAASEYKSSRSISGKVVAHPLGGHAIMTHLPVSGNYIS